MKDIKSKALLLAQEYGIKNFRASTGWYYKFLRRNKLTRRIGTHVIQKISEDYLDKIEDFLRKLRKYFHIF
jgi:NAD-dependent SIR2 family protein deacetylase